MFFEINKNISNMYSGLNPLNILDYPAEDVFNLIHDTIAYNKGQSEAAQHATKKKTVIRRPAGDDWF